MVTDSNEYRRKFQELLIELFQLESAKDLDFGIYRILNFKRDVIEQFIEKDLLDAVDAELTEGALADQAGAAKDLAAAAAKVRETLGPDALDANGDLVERYRESKIGLGYLKAQERARGAKPRPEVEAAIFNHLWSFFSHYYDAGDFLTKRRYSKRQKYAIPYNGEEVYLHWANRDQYYVKTTEHFTDYTFRAPGGVAVHFKLRAADIEKDNVKGDKRFFVPVVGDATFDATAAEVVIPFEYRPLTEQEEITYGKREKAQEAINKDASVGILKHLVKTPVAEGALSGEKKRTEKGEPVSYLDYYLRLYTARNTSDYFIHKDLKGFLERELDFYLKNEVLNVDELEAGGEARADAWFQQMRVIKAVGRKVIAFLAQLEDFQKRLFEKKKFVLETQYCITVQNIADTFYAEIAACDAQWLEWRDLLHIDEEEKNLFNAKAKSLTERRTAFLESHPTLVLDTKHFDADFRDRLLAGYDGVDEQTDGLLIKGENYQGLNLLVEKYRGGVKCVYIDPPYNTGASQILYKNDYKDSSWLALMENRLELGHYFIGADSLLIIAIDDYGLANLSKLVSYLHPEREIQRVVVNHYPGSGTGRSNITRTHEYALFVVPTDKDILRGENQGSGVRERLFRRSGTGENNYRTGRPNSFYAILVDPSDFSIKGFEPPPERSDYPRTKTKEGWERVYPLGENGSERVWSLSYESADDALRKGLLKCTQNLAIVRLIHDMNRRSLLPSMWVDKKFNAVTYGTNLLTDLFGISGLFSYPKSVFTVSSAIDAVTYDAPGSLILDYFAGSGTTGHAVINLNRRDDGDRRFILIEMAGYFDTVLLPRIKKVTFAPEWKDGKPTRAASGEETERSPRIIKCIYLESYEDSLNNIAFDNGAGQGAMAFDDYTLKYILDWETKDSATFLTVAQLEDPFNYKISIHENGVPVDKAVDLGETFNYLLGLDVATRRVYDDGGRKYVVYRGKTREGRAVAVIWRATKGWAQADYERDRAFVAAEGMTDGADDVFVNGDSAIPGARSLDPIFKARMFAPLDGGNGGF